MFKNDWVGFAMQYLVDLTPKAVSIFVDSKKESELSLYLLNEKFIFRMYAVLNTVNNERIIKVSSSDTMHS